MRLHKFVSSIVVLFFLSSFSQAFGMTETFSLDVGKTNKHSSLRSETQHKTEITIVNDTNKLICYLAYGGYKCTYLRNIYPGDGLLIYSDEKEYDSIPVELYYDDRKTVFFDDVVPNHTVLKASAYAKK